MSEEQQYGYTLTCTAPVNIAVIKYWGKRDIPLNLPINSSLSGTLHQDDLKTTTTVTASTQFKEDSIYINDQKEEINSRTQKCLNQLRQRAGTLRDPKTGDVWVTPEQWQSGDLKIHVVSHNNFPTAAGLASSAAGYGCLVAALAKLMAVPGDVSDIARLGSGSAARSLFGGWVRWEAGTLADGSDSVASQVADEFHWPEMRVLVFVVSASKKHVSSTAGMQESVATSPLIPERIEVVPKRMVEMEKAIEERDYETFARLTMLDSDHFHEVCHTTTPAIHYMNDISKSIVALVNAYNQHHGSLRAAYTFDAGPNAVIYLLEKEVDSFLAQALKFIPFSPEREEAGDILKTLDPELLARARQSPVLPLPLEPLPADSVKYVLHTKIGPGPISTEPEKIPVASE